ncbi:unnamed protein product [Brassica rapa]|uniref:Uncharacterized protein n=2 Tax=Brassica TaxID=3705 RepID=A0A8D9LZ19_BRACM|nr:unnamed protein product [Brassica napus]CAG7892342.1 unnamed protein product [Brassica rapa]
MSHSTSMVRTQTLHVSSSCFTVFPVWPRIDTCRSLDHDMLHVETHSKVHIWWLCNFLDDQNRQELLNLLIDIPFCLYSHGTPVSHRLSVMKDFKNHQQNLKLEKTLLTNKKMKLYMSDDFDNVWEKEADKNFKTFGLDEN